MIACGPYLENAGPTGITVRWASELDAPGVVRWGRAGGALEGEVGAASSELRYARDPAHRRQPLSALAPGQLASVRLYQARLADLAPGTEYRYAVEFAGRIEEGAFRTFPAAPEPFSFVAFSDTHCADAVAAAFAAHRPAFLISSGDLPDREHYPDYLEFFSPAMTAAARNVPLFVARGNHDQSGRTLSRLFSYPDGRLYYSFDHANAHFVCLDSCLWRHPGAEENIAAMLEWCEADLGASQADWKVAFFHEPPFDMSHRRTDTDFGRLRAMPVFRRCGVDLVFSGHAHSYQRFGPLYMPGENERRPITAVVSAGAGSKYMALPPRAEPQLAVRRAESNYVLVRVDGPRLELRALSPAGAELDSLTIVKAGGEPDAAYLGAAVPEEPFGSIARSLAEVWMPKAQVAAGEEFAVQVDLAAGPVPFEYEVRPSAESSGAVEPAAPAAGALAAGERAAVAVRLRARADIRRSEKGNRASPELVLECFFRAGAGRGVVSSDFVRVR